MNSFAEFSNFLIEVQYSENDNYRHFKNLFLEENIDDELSLFIDDKIATLESNVLKLALILKKYDILDKTKKNSFLRGVQEEILSIFFDTYQSEEYSYSVIMFLPNFKPLRNKDFILDYYLANQTIIGSPSGLLSTDFIVDANFNKEKLFQFLRLSIDTFANIKDQTDHMSMERVFEICEKLQIQDLKKEAAQKIVDYLYDFASREKGVRRNFIVQQSFKYIDFYGENRFTKKKELLNLILENTNDVNSYFEANQQIQRFDIDQSKYDEILERFKEIGAHQAWYEISDNLFSLYDYEKEKLKDPDLIYQIAATIAFDESGLPVYTIDKDNSDDIFFHEKAKDIQLHAILFARYIDFLRENSDFERYIQEFYLPESLSPVRDLGILNDFKECNFYGFISQMIPIIENHFRYCLGLVNEPYITPNGIGGYDYLPMKAFLESEVIREKLGINKIYILKLIFDDRRGLNYRNKLAHGILNPNNINDLEANLVFLTLINMSYFEQQLCK
ncbi:DUF4209 domain-containing protein [Acinetobacter pittii]|uniref:DUF4209 domain-containing protein n=1 Tax=Acinetobacter pittii TaxID=48296 RepID=UPI0026EF257E|nr:DUF4209 domain-containing protein [Acinetobacter pittii]MDO7197040.1 DUF4209 domain-containing protein [Acinetobacter pittii]